MSWKKRNEKRRGERPPVLRKKESFSSAKLLRYPQYSALNDLRTHSSMSSTNHISHLHRRLSEVLRTSGRWKTERQPEGQRESESTADRRKGDRLCAIVHSRSSISLTFLLRHLSLSLPTPQSLLSQAFCHPHTPSRRDANIITQ